MPQCVTHRVRSSCERKGIVALKKHLRQSHEDVIAVANSEANSAGNQHQQKQERPDKEAFETHIY